MPVYTYENLLAAMHCIAAAPPSGWKADGVSTDTRTVKQGNLFFALSGEKYDAHHFLEEAVRKGAAGLIIEKSKREICSSVLRSLPASVALYEVEDSLKALQSLASWHRRRMNAIVLAVTGSSGKTSAKEMLLSLLRGLGLKADGTSGNYNNHIGLPITLCNMETDNEFLVLEMGMNHAGEISFLSKIAKPDYALITSVSGAHIGFFKSVQDILKAKLEITDGMDEKGVLFYCKTSGMTEQAEEYVKSRKISLRTYGLSRDNSEEAGEEYQGRDFHSDPEGIRFFWNEDEIKNGAYFSPEMAENLLGCMLMLEAAGAKRASIVSAAPAVRPLTGGRFQVFKKEASGKIKILIDDSYNANGDSFCRAVSALRRILPGGKLVLFAGEMAELGEFALEEHARVGSQAGREKYARVAAIGSEYAKTLLDSYGRVFSDGEAVFASKKEDIIDGLKRYAEDADGILVKGSRSSGMEKIADAIKGMGYV